MVLEHWKRKQGRCLKNFNLVRNLIILTFVYVYVGLIDISRNLSIISKSFIFIQIKMLWSFLHVLCFGINVNILYLFIYSKALNKENCEFEFTTCTSWFQNFETVYILFLHLSIYIIIKKTKDVSFDELSIGQSFYIPFRSSNIKNDG